MASWPAPGPASQHAAAALDETVPVASTSQDPHNNSRKHVIDLDQINGAFQHWLSAIKLKDSKPRRAEQQLDTHESVFSPFAPALPHDPQDLPLRTMDDEAPISEEEFLVQVKRVEEAIEQGLHPRLNPKGSSGSYFCKDLEGNTIGIFKPKDEEPYGRLNPKWTKWFHRHFIAPVFGFGRSCLIPNLSYLSEEAASVLDRRLHTHIVPRTQVVSLSSTAFFYDWMDRRAASGKRPRPLPAKSGSFQLFGKGFTDASIFLNEHRWPGVSELPADAASQPPKHRSRGLMVLKMAQKLCGRAEATETDDKLGEDEDPDPRGFVWTRSLMDDTRQQLERLVILDYLMRNTDRGLDNFMLRVCRNEDATGDSTPVEGTVQVQPGKMPNMSHLAASVQPLRRPKSVIEISDQSHTHLLAIDNSLSFPQHHPRGWRSFAYGWLWLPVSMIGVPWSSQTRGHFLALLTDKQWWQETSRQLRHTFAKDPDFNHNQFQKQLALIKGQGLNLVKSLKNPVEGPLELCQRTSCLVWDDVVKIPDPSQLADYPDLTQSLHGDFPIASSSLADEQTPLIEGQGRKTRRLSRFARRFRRGTSSSQDQPPPLLPRQLSSKEHADSNTEDSLASGFSLLDGIHKRLPTKKSRSASFGTMPDLEEQRPSEEVPDSAISSRPTHIRWQSSLGGSAEAIPLKRVIVERVEVIHQKPYFAIC